jgi:hypothetical protein
MTFRTMNRKARTPTAAQLSQIIHSGPTNAKKFSWYYYVLLAMITIGLFVVVFASKDFIAHSVVLNDQLTPLPVRNKIESPLILFPDVFAQSNHSVRQLQESLLNHPSPSTAQQQQQQHIIPSFDPSVEEIVRKIDPEYRQWKERVYQKLVCLKHHKLVLFFYHVRKAAGTTIRDMMKYVSFRQRVPFFETEGIVINPVIADLLDGKNVFTMVSFRHPLQRIVSLYWYEHVSWYYSILKKPQRIKTMSEWIATWQDGTEYKNAILARFPYNNYVEIENYYVKLLIGYNHVVDKSRPLTDEDLEKAKSILRKFDMILISEWMSDDEENSLLQAFHRHYYQFQSTGKSVVIPSKIKGDKKMKENMKSTLAADEVRTRVFIFCC